VDFVHYAKPSGASSGKPKGGNVCYKLMGVKWKNSPVDYGAQYGEQNYQNAIAFGNYPDSNVIGVTSVWYTRAGKQIVEFDMLLNTDFNWGDVAIEPVKMDLENIVTHEAGHAVGLSDIYSGSCSSVTMYGYSTEGETSKRTLEQADISGLQAMYGI